MNDENKKKYLCLLSGYTGILLTMFAIVRYMSIIQDTIGITLAIFGAIFLGTFLNFAEKKMGVAVKEMVIFRIGSITILLLLIFIFI